MSVVSSISCRWRNLAKRERTQSIPEFQEQPDHAGKKHSTRAGLVEDPIQVHTGFYIRIQIAYRRAVRLFHSCVQSAFRILFLDSRQEAQKQFPLIKEGAARRLV